MKLFRLLSGLFRTINAESLEVGVVLAENKIFRKQVPVAAKTTDTDRRTLAEIGKKLGRKVLGEIGSIVRPETVLGWYSKLVAKKWDTSKRKRSLRGGGSGR